MKKKLTSALSILFALAFILSCSAPSSYVPKEPAKGVYHRVKKGETFWSIARAYNVRMQDLAAANNVNNPDSIEEGSIVFIPAAGQVIDDVLTVVKKMDAENKAVARSDSGAEVKAPKGKTTGKSVSSDAASSKEAKVKQRENAPATGPTPVQKSGNAKTDDNSRTKPKSTTEEKENLQFEKKRFIWPVEHHAVKTRFGIQPNKIYHNWIKIVSVDGAPVKAADDGIVIFSAPLKDYGNTIIVRHKNSYATVYTHLKKISVKTDKKIQKGDVIAFLGERDEAGDAYMNFEVRLHGKARNPLFFLP
ncbi:MAG: M23 family metallopeptidase [Syntrophaceae bacterium]|nr:M23 family metallopeptidase [Syntrophaceae bacterium]